MTELRVVLYQEGDQWVAQGLERDIRAQASNLKDLQERFDAAVEAECRESIKRHGEAFKGIDPAPEIFFKKWEECHGSYRPSQPSSAGQYAMALCA